MKQKTEQKKVQIDLALMQAKVRQLEIRVRKLFRGTIGGNHRSFNRGIGFDFDQLREYERGDDVRFIDWKAFSRCQAPMIRLYREEQSRVIMIAIDTSVSLFFSSGEKLKYTLASEVAALIALIAGQYNDAVGYLLFAEDVELYIAPGRGITHLYHALEKICFHTPQGKQARFGAIAEQLALVKRKDVILFIITDMIMSSDEIHSSLNTISKIVTTTVVRILDPNEIHLPAVGFVSVTDSESGEEITLDLRKGKQQLLQKILTSRIEEQNKKIRTWGIDCISLHDEKQLVDDLVRYFKAHVHKSY